MGFGVLGEASRCGRARELGPQTGAPLRSRRLEPQQHRAPWREERTERRAGRDRVGPRQIDVHGDDVREPIEPQLRGGLLERDDVHGRRGGELRESVACLADLECRAIDADEREVRIPMREELEELPVAAADFEDPGAPAWDDLLAEPTEAAWGVAHSIVGEWGCRERSISTRALA